jgi:hypothetical protein
MKLKRSKKLNPLLTNWPTGVVYTTAWLNNLGIPPSLINKYRESNWVKTIGRGAIARVGDNVDWKGGIWAIQNQLNLAIYPGAKTALELSGYGHFLPFNNQIITLFGQPSLKLPLWFKEYNKNLNLRYFTTNLFEKVPDLGLTEKKLENYSILISSPERAMMEVLYLVPKLQSFQESMLLMEGLNTLRPSLVQKLLENCKSIKVKRLFMFLAEYLSLPWLNSINITEIDLGSGKRLIVKGGKLDSKYQITVPEDIFNE